MSGEAGRCYRAVMGWPGFETNLGDLGTIVDVGLGRGAFRGAIILEGVG